MASVHRVPKVGKDERGQVRWRVRWRRPDESNPRSLSFETERGARECRARVEADPSLMPEQARSGLAPQDDPPRRTFRQVAETYLGVLDVRPRQVKDYRRALQLHVYPLLGDLPIDTITVADVQDYVNRMRDAGRAPKTILNVHGSVVVPVFDFAQERDWRGPHHFRVRSQRRGARRDGSGGAIHVPGRRGRPVTRDTVLLPEEAPTFIAAAYQVDEDTGDLVSFLYLTGMRWGEVVPLRIGDLDLTADPPIAVVRQVVRRNDEGEFLIEDDEGKSIHAFRDVLLSDHAVAILTRRAAGKGPDDLVFPAPRGGQIRYNAWHQRRWIKVIARAAATGLTKPLTPHKLRHGYATAMIDGGVGLDYVCAQLGHSSITVTQTLYVHLTKRRAEASRSVIDLAFHRLPEPIQPGPADDRRLSVVRNTAS